MNYSLNKTIEFQKQNDSKEGKKFHVEDLFSSGSPDSFLMPPKVLHPTTFKETLKNQSIVAEDDHGKHITSNNRKSNSMIIKRNNLYSQNEKHENNIDENKNELKSKQVEANENLHNEHGLNEHGLNEHGHNDDDDVNIDEEELWEGIVSITEDDNQTSFNSKEQQLDFESKEQQEQGGGYDWLEDTTYHTHHIQDTSLDHEPSLSLPSKVIEENLKMNHHYEEEEEEEEEEGADRLLEWWALTESQERALLSDSLTSTTRQHRRKPSDQLEHLKINEVSQNTHAAPIMDASVWAPPKPRHFAVPIAEVTRSFPSTSSNQKGVVEDGEIEENSKINIMIRDMMQQVGKVFKDVAEERLCGIYTDRAAAFLLSCRDFLQRAIVDLVHQSSDESEEEFWDENSENSSFSNQQIIGKIVFYILKRLLEKNADRLWTELITEAQSNNDDIPNLKNELIQKFLNYLASILPYFEKYCQTKSSTISNGINKVYSQKHYLNKNRNDDLLSNYFNKNQFKKKNEKSRIEILEAEFKTRSKSLNGDLIIDDDSTLPPLLDQTKNTHAKEYHGPESDSGHAGEYHGPESHAGEYHGQESHAREYHGPESHAGEYHGPESHARKQSSEFMRASEVWSQVEGYRELKAAMTKRQKEEREALKSKQKAQLQKLQQQLQLQSLQLDRLHHGSKVSARRSKSNEEDISPSMNEFQSVPLSHFSYHNSIRRKDNEMNNEQKESKLVNKQFDTLGEKVINSFEIHKEETKNDELKVGQSFEQLSQKRTFNQEEEEVEILQRNSKKYKRNNDDDDDAAVVDDKAKLSNCVENGTLANSAGTQKVEDDDVDDGVSYHGTNLTHNLNEKASMLIPYSHVSEENDDVVECGTTLFNMQHHVLNKHDTILEEEKEEEITMKNKSNENEFKNNAIEEDEKDEEDDTILQNVKLEKGEYFIKARKWQSSAEQDLEAATTLLDTAKTPTVMNSHVKDEGDSHWQFIRKILEFAQSTIDITNTLNSNFNLSDKIELLNNLTKAQSELSALGDISAPDWCFSKLTSIRHEHSPASVVNSDIEVFKNVTSSNFDSNMRSIPIENSDLEQSEIIPRNKFVSGANNGEIDSLEMNQHVEQARKHQLSSGCDEGDSCDDTRVEDELKRSDCPVSPPDVLAASLLDSLNPNPGFRQQPKYQFK